MKKIKLIQQTEHQVFISSHQMNIKDSEISWDGSFENEDSYDVGIGVATGVIGLTDFSRSAGLSPVLIELYDAEPGTEDINDYSGVIEASIIITSGKLSVESIDTNDIEIFVPVGIYRVRVYYGNDDTCRYDYEDGANHARIVLFPQEKMEEIEVLKKKENSDDVIQKYQGSRNEK